jgi:hypothetical protein
MIDDTPTPGMSHQHPRPFRQILPADALERGEIYFGWPCRACALPIAIDRTGSIVERIPDDRFVEVTCPHCKKTDVHTWAARTDVQYSPTE